MKKIYLFLSSRLLTPALFFLPCLGASAQNSMSPVYREYAGQIKFIVHAPIVHLVPVTALLTSCNRIIIPANPAAGLVADATLMTAPPAEDSSCSCEHHMPDQNNPVTCSSYNFGGYISESYFPGPIYRKGSFRGGRQFIFRGGFGKSSMTPGS